MSEIIFVIEHSLNYFTQLVIIIKLKQHFIN
jgi:hypothetical protein